MNSDRTGLVITTTGHPDIKLVRLDFSQSVNWITMSPVEAFEFASNLIEKAKEAKGNANK